MTTKLIDWDKTLLILNKLSLIRVFIAIVSSSTDDLKWYSNEETRAQIAWRWQIGPSTVKYAINKLTTLKVIELSKRGVYTINKEYLRL